MTRIGSGTRAHRLAGFALALGLAAGVAPAAGAADERVDDAQFEAIRSALEARGYTEVSDAELDDGHFEVDARNPEGHEVDLELDPQSLEILHEERE